MPLGPPLLLRRLLYVGLALWVGLVNCAVADSQTLESLRANVLDSATIPATGKGAVSIRVRLWVGADAVALDTAVRAVVRSGDALLEPGSPSADLVADRFGDVTLALMPGTKSGPIDIQLGVGEQTVDVALMLTAADRQPIVVGFATGGIGSVPGWIEAPDSANNGPDARRGQLSFYGPGKIARNTRGTFAYDSADNLAQSLQTGPYLANPNDRPFPIYGDTSTRYDDALSTNRFYGRVENGLSSAMWGEFYARAASQAAVGGYTMLVDGGQAVARGTSAGVSAFTARNNVAYARQVISPTGLAIASQMLHPDIVVGSDVLQLVHLDRRTGAIVSQSALIRGSDYSIDYASGLLRFLNVILPYDGSFNPQIVVVQYQYGGPGANSTMFGGDGSVKLERAGLLEAWYLNDSAGNGNLTLLGQSLSGSSANSSWALSHEHTAGFLATTPFQYGSDGNAYLASLNIHAKRARGSIDYTNATAAYDNPFGSYTTPGLVSLRATAETALGRISDLEFGYLFARNTLPQTPASEAVDNSDVSAGVTLGVRPSTRFSYHVGVQAQAASSNGVIDPALLLSGTTIGSGPNDFFPPLFSATSYQAGTGHSIDGQYGFDWKFAPRADVIVSRSMPLSNQVDPYDPPQTQAEIDVRTGDNTKAFLRQLWQRTSTQPLAATQLVPPSAAPASSATSLGFEQLVGATTFQSGYAVDHTVNGTDLFDALGVRGRIVATKRLTTDGFLQVGQELFSSYGTPLGSTSPYFVALGTSLAYSESSFHATGQAQIRGGYDSGSTVQFGATGPISPAVSLYGSFTGSFTQFVRQVETQFGLSYRPSRNDRYVTLASVDEMQSNLTDYNAYVTNVAQIQELYRPSTHTELAGSLAYKLTGDSFFSPGTSIIGLRGDQRIGSRFDLGSEVHWSDIAPLDGARSTGLAIEGGYRVGSTLRAAIGYNFSGFADPTASVNPTHRGIYVTVSSYIDRIFGWGKE